MTTAMATGRAKDTVLKRLCVSFDESGRPVLFTGAFTAVMQTLLFREIFTVVAGNELVIGILFAVWLAATAAGGLLGGRYPHQQQSVKGCFLLVVSLAALIGVRAVRLLLLPGEAVAPLVVLALLLCTVAPVAALGGFIFGSLAGAGRGREVYRWEQTGSLAGLAALSVGVGLLLPNYLIAVGMLLLLMPLYDRWWWRITAVAAAVLLVAADRATTSWKYPAPLATIVYAPEGEVATAVIDGKKTIMVNGTVYRTDFSTPAVEQSVHAPLSMRRKSRRVLLINDAGQSAEARKYAGVAIRCIRTDRLITDTGCPYTAIDDLEAGAPFDAVILGSSMPDNIAAGRFFTKSFYRRMQKFTGDSGVFSVTLPFQSEFPDRRDRAVRDIVVATLRSVFDHVFVLPGEGLTFIASDVSYPPPDTCIVANDYFQNVILAGCTKKRIAEANAPPEANTIHTASHPLLLSAAAGRYLAMFGVQWWMYVALPVVITLLLLSVPSMRSSPELLSVGSSGFCTGVSSIALMLLYQAVYGTVYSHVSLLLLALSAGFAAGSFVRRFPFSDMIVGLVLCGTLLMLCTIDTPAPPLFFLGNAAAGFVAAAQFVTRKKTPTGRLYAADCTGGVLGMALASTVLLPMFGTIAVAIGIAVVKVGVGWGVGRGDEMVVDKRMPGY
jgi:spermidine synthase